MQVFAVIPELKDYAGGWPIYAYALRLQNQRAKKYQNKLKRKSDALSDGDISSEDCTAAVDTGHQIDALKEQKKTNEVINAMEATGIVDNDRSRAGESTTTSAMPEELGYFSDKEQRFILRALMSAHKKMASVGIRAELYRLTDKISKCTISRRAPLFWRGMWR